MIVLAGTLRIPDDSRDEIMEAIHTLQCATLANDPGVIVFHFSVDIQDANLIHVYEEWDSVENLKAHGQQEHMQPFRRLRTDKGIEVVRFSRWRAEDLGKF